jgi:tRNA dimethylallyltransferase
MTDLFADCWYLTGATAVGKTAVGLALANRLNAEIISLDSMAVYRGMDIGTAKPTPAERALVPHHLLDIVDPADEFSVAQYVEAAAKVVADLQARGKAALFVGGTPLYLKSLLRGLFEGPPANWELREQIEEELELVGQEALHERLRQLDPVAAANIHPHDTRRLIRALEVFRATGLPLSHQQTQFDDGRPAEECRVFVLRRNREEQHRRIEDRVEAMLVAGLIDEVKRLCDFSPLPLVEDSPGRREGWGEGGLGRTARQAVGYREVRDYLAGEIDHAQMVEQIKIRSRRFAKRQGTWFRSLSECRFVDIAGHANPGEIATVIWKSSAGPAPSSR